MPHPSLLLKRRGSLQSSDMNVSTLLEHVSNPDLTPPSFAGPREAALTEASKQLVPLFEELLTTIVERNFDSGGSSPRGKSPLIEQEIKIDAKWV